MVLVHQSQVCFFFKRSSSVPCSIFRSISFAYFQIQLTIRLELWHLFLKHTNGKTHSKWIDEPRASELLPFVHLSCFFCFSRMCTNERFYGPPLIKVNKMIANEWNAEHRANAVLPLFSSSHEIWRSAATGGSNSPRQWMTNVECECFLNTPASLQIMEWQIDPPSPCVSKWAQVFHLISHIKSMKFYRSILFLARCR